MCTALHAFIHINQQQMGCNLILIHNITSNTLKNFVPLLCPHLSAVSSFHIGSFAINRFCKSSAALSSSDLFHEVFVQINRKGINSTLIKALTTLTTLPDRTSRGEKMTHAHTALEANVLTVWCYVVYWVFGGRVSFIPFSIQIRLVFWNQAIFHIQIGVIPLRSEPFLNS